MGNGENSEGFGTMPKRKSLYFKFSYKANGSWAGLAFPDKKKMLF